ncbi:peptidase C39 family protein [Pseudocolwellia sp. HL-MZ19]|uniref:peptidase C39 family protein n=1 Tax=unclassified Pseudocolwellia TaxID=2848178 RepID=UPI003CE9E3EA
MNTQPDTAIGFEEVQYRKAQLSDINDLLVIESTCFTSDKISKRSFIRWINSDNGIFIVAHRNQEVVGYGLVYCHKGRRLVRLYSMAVLPAARKQGIAEHLLQQLEQAAAAQGRLFMRLEVNKNNHNAIRLYEAAGYRIFGEYSDYYEDHSDALRMQKKVLRANTHQISRITPWYAQTTAFTCGPSALMMAMTSLDDEIELSQVLELALWREATTIFMTSGHGGCHPIGLGLAAKRRGFEATVYINTEDVLFTDGVRTEDKKQIMTTVDNQFKAEALELGVEINYQTVEQDQISLWLEQGYAVLVLISTYRLDGKKSPHWVTVTHIDDMCLYVHDPDLDEHEHNGFDCQHVPIARDDFDKMASFGASRLRTAVVIKK